MSVTSLSVATFLNLKVQETAAAFIIIDKKEKKYQSNSFITVGLSLIYM